MRRSRSSRRTAVRTKRAPRAERTDFDTCVHDVVQTAASRTITPSQSNTGPCSALLSDAAPPACDACFPDSNRSRDPDPTTSRLADANGRLHVRPVRASNLVLALLLVTLTTACATTRDDRRRLGRRSTRSTSRSLVRRRRRPDGGDTMQPTNPPHQNACTRQQIADYAQCQGAKITDALHAIQAGGSAAACGSCIETPFARRRRHEHVGRHRLRGSTAFMNVEGCVNDALGQPIPDLRQRSASSTVRGASLCSACTGATSRAASSSSANDLYSDKRYASLVSPPKEPRWPVRGAQRRRRDRLRRL